MIEQPDLDVSCAPILSPAASECGVPIEQGLSAGVARVCGSKIALEAHVVAIFAQPMLNYLELAFE